MNKLILVFATLTFASLAYAQEKAGTTNSYTCRARPVESFYCPHFSGIFWGPYWDKGCEVTCRANQRAICTEATCEAGQTGEPTPATCGCY